VKRNNINGNFAFIIVASFLSCSFAYKITLVFGKGDCFARIVCVVHWSRSLRYVEQI